MTLSIQVFPIGKYVLAFLANLVFLFSYQKFVSGEFLFLKECYHIFGGVVFFLCAFGENRFWVFLVFISLKIFIAELSSYLPVSFRFNVKTLFLFCEFIYCVYLEFFEPETFVELGSHIPWMISYLKGIIFWFEGNKEGNKEKSFELGYFTYTSDHGSMPILRFIKRIFMAYSYFFSPMTLFAGPTIEYKTHVNYLLKIDQTEWVFDTAVIKNQDFQILFVTAVFLIPLYIFFWFFRPFSWLISPEYSQNSFLVKLLYAFLLGWTSMSRYLIWILIEMYGYFGDCFEDPSRDEDLSSSLGKSSITVNNLKDSEKNFNQIDSTSKLLKPVVTTPPKRCNFLQNIDFYKVLISFSPKDILRCWNQHANNAFKRHVQTHLEDFEFVKKNFAENTDIIFASFGTLLFMILWRGLYLSYFIVFFMDILWQSIDLRIENIEFSQKTKPWIIILRRIFYYMNLGYFNCIYELKTWPKVQTLLFETYCFMPILLLAIFFAFYFWDLLENIKKTLANKNK